jgi:enamine deaminase RidA (YjgF/YER057c/UK114 family)
MSHIMQIKLPLALPPAPKPAGKYSAAVRAGNLLFLSGQFPVSNGASKYSGRIGAELSEEDGYAAARLAALNVLAQIQVALGSLDRLEQLVRVEGHIASAPGWNNAPRVLDGASDLFAFVLGKRGRHTRTAFTPTQLPLNHAIELVVTVAVKPD